MSQLDSLMNSIADIRDAVHRINTAATEQIARDSAMADRDIRLQETLSTIVDLATLMERLTESGLELAKVQSDQMTSFSNNVKKEVKETISDRLDRTTTVVNDTMEGLQATILHLLDNTNEQKKELLDVITDVTALRKENTTLVQIVQDHRRTTTRLSKEVADIATTVTDAFAFVRAELEQIHAELASRRSLLPRKSTPESKKS